MIEHMEVIRSYSAMCNSAVELGVYDCTSTWALMAGCPKKLTSYDIERRTEVDEVESVAAESGTIFKFILADSVSIEIDEVDLLFIDSMHTYEHLSKELSLHSKKVRKFIILHDTTTFGDVGQTGGLGLWAAVVEFLDKYPQWVVHERRTNCHGLTVLSRVSG